MNDKLDLIHDMVKTLDSKVGTLSSEVHDIRSQLSFFKGASYVVSGVVATVITILLAFIRWIVPGNGTH